MTGFYNGQHQSSLATLNPRWFVVVALLMLCLVFGYVAVIVGGVVPDRPILLAWPPLFAILVINHLVKPSLLAGAATLFRANLIPIFGKSKAGRGLFCSSSWN